MSEKGHLGLSAALMLPGLRRLPALLAHPKQYLSVRIDVLLTFAHQEIPASRLPSRGSELCLFISSGSVFVLGLCVDMLFSTWRFVENDLRLFSPR